MTKLEPTDPWYTPSPPQPEAEARRRYQRALRLSQFARDIERGARLMMTPAMLDYRRQCLDRWQDYLDGWTPPLPERDGGRPPKIST